MESAVRDARLPRRRPDGSDASRYVVAGHPPPLDPLARTARRRSSSRGARSRSASTRRSQFEAGEAQLEQGSTIVLYTDGLVERRGTPLDEGLAPARRVGRGERGRSRGARRGGARSADRRQRAARRHRRAGDPVRGGGGRRPPARAAVDPGRPRRDAARSFARGSQRGKVDEPASRPRPSSPSGRRAPTPSSTPSSPSQSVVQASGDARRRRPDADRGPGQRPVEAGRRDRPSAASVWG